MLDRIRFAITMLVLVGLTGAIVGVTSTDGHAAAENVDVPGSWRTGTDMPTPRTEVTSALLDGMVLVAGGFPISGGHTDLVEAYDIAADSWSPLQPLPVELDHAGAASVGGKVYVVGGFLNFGQGVLSSATYEYDPVGDSWTTRTPMPLARASAATVELDGLIYVLGGVGPQATVPLVYDPSDDSWLQLAPMSEEREHLTAAVVGNVIYVVGGRQNVIQNVATLEAYTPATDSWQLLPPMPTARGGLASAAIAGRVHVVGGEDLAPGGGTFPEHEVYDPQTNSWLKAVPLPTSRHGLTAQGFNEELLVIAGGPQPALSVSGVVEIFELASVGGIADLPDVTGDGLEQPPVAEGTRRSSLLVLIATMGIIVVAAGALLWMRRSPS
ncbi:MAG: galactose oxidase [Chloroflexi bacterium]|nr:galactose oxidase [Chloroflexota bacterium]